MRATERLLEVIQEAAAELGPAVTRDLRTQADHGSVRHHVSMIESASAELRHRGDTLVRARDLVLVIRAADRGPGAYPTAEDATQAAIERLAKAIVKSSG